LPGTVIIDFFILDITIEEVGALKLLLLLI